jgi:hypothetical protein
MFALMGALYLLGSAAMGLGMRTPGQGAPSRYSELIDGFEGLAFGLVYGLMALGKRNSLARVLFSGPVRAEFAHTRASENSA